MPAAAAVNMNGGDEAYPSFTDKYEVARVIGRGGMGTVFEARHTRLGHRVAIKVLGNELRVHPELVKRFEREARAAGSLSSPYAVRIFDIDQTDDGTPFMVMELLSGCDLGHLIERDGAQEMGVAVRWIIEASDAIAEAHRLGIIHRDIKPSNLLLCSASGSIKVLDFGIAKRVPVRGSSPDEPREAAITQGIAPLGTPQYMSPEQVRCAKDVDLRTDIWSLAVTLYELLTGRPPYNHDVPQACVASIVADPVPDPRTFRDDIPEELAHAILRALSKDANDRFQCVDDFVEALAPFSESPLPLPTPASAQHHADPRAAVSSMRRIAKDDTTLDGEDLVLELPETSRKRILEETPPPAVSRANVVSRGKRVRSSIALAGAAMLGLIALVATPKCVGSHLDAAAAASQGRAALIAQQPTTTLATQVVLAQNENEGETPLPDPQQQEQPSSPHVVAATLDATPTPKAVASSQHVTTATSAAAKPPRVSHMPVRVIGSERPVHGGISNPGF